MEIPLTDAMLCAECEMVTVRAPDGRCAHCGSEAVMDLSRILNRGSDASEVWTRLFTGDPQLSVSERLKHD